jgi:hypothetical protein
MSTEEELVRHAIENFEGPWPIIKGCSGNAWWLPNDDPQRGQLLSINTVIAIIGYALAKAGAQVWQDKDCWRIVGSSHKKHPTHFHALFASAKAQGLVTPKDTDNDEWPVPDDVTPKEKP